FVRRDRREGFGAGIGDRAPRNCPQHVKRICIMRICIILNIVVARAIGGNLDEKSIPWIFVRSETPYRTAGRSSYGRRTPLHGRCRRWTKYGIGAAADSEGAGRQPDDPSKSCAGKAAVLGPAFVGTPRGRLRVVPSSPNRLREGPRPFARPDGHRLGPP